MATIGICSWILGIKDLDRLMAKVMSLGFNGIQYCEAMTLYSAEDVKAAAESYGLELIFYDPFDCHPGKFNGKSTLTHAVAFYEKALEFAAQLGCGLTLQGLGTWLKHCRLESDAWRFLLAAVQRISRHAVRLAVPLAYEPCNLYEVPYIHTASDVARLITESGCDNVALVLDSFHMNIGEKEPLQVLRKWAGSIAAFHVSGSNREGIGQSHIDFKKVYNVLYENGFAGPCVFESVLSDNPVNTPPRNEKEMRKLSEILIESRIAWQGYGN